MYLVFGGGDKTPDGGMDDLIGAYVKLKDAVSAAQLFVTGDGREPLEEDWVGLIRLEHADAGTWTAETCNWLPEVCVVASTMFGKPDNITHLNPAPLLAEIKAIQVEGETKGDE